MNDGALGFGVDDTSCLGLSDDEDAQRAPCSRSSTSTRGEGGAAGAATPPEAGLGSGQLALRALEMLRKTQHQTPASTAAPRSATSQPVEDVLRVSQALAADPAAAHAASQAPPRPRAPAGPSSEPRAPRGPLAPAGMGMGMGMGVPAPGGIPGPAGSISPDAALVPPTQFLRGPCKKKRVARTPDDAGRARGVGADAAGLFCAAAGEGFTEDDAGAAAAGVAGSEGDQDEEENKDSGGSGDGTGGGGSGADGSLILQSKLGKRACARAEGGAGAGAVDEAVFREGAWVAMLQAVRAPPFGAHRFATSVARVLAGGFREKVGELAVAVRGCADLGGAVRLTLADVTGTMDGMLARGAALQRPDVVPGAVLVLRSVSVFSPSPRNHYLNILAGNIAHVFAPGAAADVLPLAAELALATQRRALYAAPCDPVPVSAPTPASRTAAGEPAPKPPNRLRIEATGPLRPRPPPPPPPPATPPSRGGPPPRRNSSGGRSAQPAPSPQPQGQPQGLEAGSQRFRGTIAPVLASTQPGSQAVRIAAKPRAPVIVAPSPVAARSQGSPTQTQTSQTSQMSQASQGRPQPVVVGTPLRRATPARPVLISHPFTPGRTAAATGAATGAAVVAQPGPAQERATSSPPRTQTIVVGRAPVVPRALPPADEAPDFDAFLDSVL